MTEAFETYLLLIIGSLAAWAAYPKEPPTVADAVFANECTPLPLSGSPDGLVTAFRHLCRRGARKFWRTGLERCDLEQVAAIGLIKAARRYDPNVGTPFEPYAWTFVVGELMHYVRDCERSIRLPRRLSGLDRRWRRVHRTLLAALGREPSDAELAAELGVLPPVINELRAAREATSLKTLEEGGAEAIAAPDSLAFEDHIAVDEALSELSPLERHVIAGVYLFGFTQLEMARRIGMSPKRVSRIVHRALGSMARALAS